MLDATDMPLMVDIITALCVLHNLCLLAEDTVEDMLVDKEENDNGNEQADAAGEPAAGNGAATAKRAYILALVNQP